MCGLRLPDLEERVSVVAVSLCLEESSAYLEFLSKVGKDKRSLFLSFYINRFGPSDMHYYTWFPIQWKFMVSWTRERRYRILETRHRHEQPTNERNEKRQQPTAPHDATLPRTNTFSLRCLCLTRREGSSGACVQRCNLPLGAMCGSRIVSCCPRQINTSPDIAI